MALESAIMLSKLDSTYSNDDLKTPSSLEWIVEAYCDLADAKCQIRDYDGALYAVNEACELSRKSDPVCWELMAQICQQRNDSEKELFALKSLFAIPVPEGLELPRDVANRRRTQGFRLAKLERDAV